MCAFGCPTGAKQHTGITYVPARGGGRRARVHRRRARRVLVDARRARRGVEARTRGGGRLTRRAPTRRRRRGHDPHAAAARGAAGSAAPGQLGRNLALHPATGAWALMDEDVDMARGVPQSYYVDEFAAEGIMLEGVAGPAGLRSRWRSRSRATGTARLMLRYRHVAQFGLMVSRHARAARVRAVAGRADHPLRPRRAGRRDRARAA